MLILFLFLAALFATFYAYFGYPVSLLCLRAFKRKPVQREEITPHISFIITAFNEEKRIKEKLDNSLKLVYPREKLQIIVASDGSTDGTNNIVSSFARQGVELLEVKNRGGKENAQKEAVARAKGDILVFSDVATMIDPDGLKKIAANFADPSVGCVSSEDKLLDRDGKPSGEGFYVRYEMWLRRLESSVNSLVGLSGSFFAARKKVCLDFAGDVQSDFRTLLNSVKQGLRGVADPLSVGYYMNLTDKKREFDRKIRTVLRGLTVFWTHTDLLNPLAYGLFAYQFFCHKLLRWLVPFFLAVAFATNLILAFDSLLFQVLFFGQMFFYGMGIVGWKTEKLHGIFKIPTFFLIVNAAILIAWWKYLKGERIVLWTPSQR